MKKEQETRSIEVIGLHGIFTTLVLLYVSKVMLSHTLLHINRNNMDVNASRNYRKGDYEIVPELKLTALFSYS